MLTIKEMRLNSKSQPTLTDTSSSSPTILLAEANARHGNGGRDARSSQCSNEPRVFFNFGKGFCHFGGACKFVQDPTSHAKYINNSHDGASFVTQNTSYLWSNLATALCLSGITHGSHSNIADDITPIEMLIQPFAAGVGCFFVAVGVSGNSCLFVDFLGASSLAIALPDLSYVVVDYRRGSYLGLSLAIHLLLCHEYVPDPMELEDHVPVYIPEPEHPEDLVPAEDEAPTPLLPPSFLSPRSRPLSPRALEVEMRDIASAFYHSLHPSGTPPLLPIPAPSTSRRADIPEADTPPRKRLLLTTPRPGYAMGDQGFRDIERRMMTALEMVNMRVSYQVDVCSRESSEFYTRHHDAQKDRAAVRAEIEVLRRERLAYEQESMETRQALARSEAHCRALEARVTVLETEVRRHEWQRQAADDLAVQYIMRTQALEAGARVDTLEDTGSSS
ncbi:hypothetical protein Tco_0613796 [Tanacetum coccineum]